MCGIIAILQQQGHAASEIHEGLGLLQHRGQDAAGIVTCGKGGRFYQCKANGMVRDVFEPHNLANLHGSMGVGHGAYFCFLMQFVTPPPARLRTPRRSPSM